MKKIVGWLCAVLMLMLCAPLSYAQPAEDFEWISPSWWQDVTNLLTLEEEETATYDAPIPEHYVPSCGEYFYRRLTPLQQKVYAALVTAMKQIGAEQLRCRQNFSVTVDTGVPLDQTSFTQFKNELSMRTVADALWNDHTEFFWFTRFRVHYVGDGSTVTLTVFSDSTELFGNDEALRAAAKAAQEQVEALCRDLPGKAQERVMFLVRWLCENNTYNEEHAEYRNYPLAHTAYSALTSENDAQTGPVCQGFSYAFKWLCDRAGIEAVNVAGVFRQTAGDGAHSWSLVRIGGAWYAVDLTETDGLQTEAFACLAGSETPSFETTFPTFSDAHVPDEKDYPMLFPMAYSPSAVTEAGTGLRIEPAALRVRVRVKKDAAAAVTCRVLVLPVRMTGEQSLWELYENGDDRLLCLAAEFFGEDGENRYYTAVIDKIPETAYGLELAVLPLAETPFGTLTAETQRVLSIGAIARAAVPTQPADLAEKLCRMVCLAENVGFGDGEIWY